MSPARQNIDERAQVYADWVDRGLRKPGKTGSGLSEVLGIERTQISKIRHGNRKIQAHELEIIAQYINEPLPLGAPMLTNGSSGAGGGAKTGYDDPKKHAGKHPQPLDILMHRFVGLKQKTLAVKDRAMSAVIPPGDVVIYVPYWEAYTALRESVVVVKTGGRLICRKLVRDDGEWFLAGDAERVADQVKVMKVKADKGRTDPHCISKEAIIGLVIWRGRSL